VSAATLEALDGPQLADALRAGIYRLFARTDHINKINVFPVPDGDTGTNMSMTLAAVLPTLERDTPRHAGQLLTRIADAALDGARGNSGAILAQFLLGVGDRVGHLERLDATSFAAAVRVGATYARDALTQPREGTLLTVLTDFAAELERLVGEAKAADFRALFSAVIEPVRRSLAGTQGVLEETRIAGVVDAGAQGFVDLIEGMTAWLARGEMQVVAAPVHGGNEEMVDSGPGDLRHRYCTECMITGAELDPRRVRESLGAFGSSLVVGGTRNKLRIHIHTNDPEQLFEFVAQYGSISAQKADDMRAQRSAAHHASSRRVAIVTDSAADLPDSLLESLELHMVPVRVHFGGRSYLDKVTLTSEEFYREIEHNPDPPKTSQPPPGDFRRLYEFLASHYESVLSISLSSRVSGSYNAAVSAAQRIEGGRVRVLDSASVSLGQGLVAIRAAELAMAGADLDAVERGARAARARIQTWALTSTLDFAVRGGRVPPMVRTLSRLLRFMPVLHTTSDGLVRPCGVLWVRRRRIERFADFILRRLPPAPRYRLLVGHGRAEAEAQALLAALGARIANIESAHLTTLGTALGVHGGPGLLVVAIEACDEAGAITTPGSPAQGGLAGAAVASQAR
jgi:DegV family protein with EDD domain